MTNNKVLLIGYSSIARRRILPALAAIGVKQVDVASLSSGPKIVLPRGMGGTLFTDYSDALRRSDAAVAYISTPNCLHYELAVSALKKRFHVIIDKPATTSLEDTAHLCELAQETGYLLAEAAVYCYHPQIAAVRKAFEEAGCQPTQILSAFSYPRLPKNNFRHRANLGGGALMDLASYAITPGRLFWGEKPIEVFCRCFKNPGDEVDQMFTLMATYPGNRSLVGQFGMATGYINNIRLLGSDVVVNMDRVFTTPPDMVCEHSMIRSDSPRTITVPAHDSFEVFLREVFKAIAWGKTKPFADTMLTDAEVMDMLQASIDYDDADE